MRRLPAFHAAIALLSFVGAAALANRLPPAATVHLVVAVGVMPLIFAAIVHFVPVLTRSRNPPLAVQLLPLLALAAGGLAVPGFLSRAAAPWLFTVAAALGCLAALVLALWSAWRASEAVGGAHPGAYWYVAAAGCLALGLGTMLLAHGAGFPGLKRFHLHLNLLGFVAITATGTLQVLMPTVAGRPDPGAARRLRLHLGPVVAGTLLVAGGAAAFPMAAWAGAVLWLATLLAVAAAWWRTCRSAIFAPHGAAPPLAAALAGLTLVVAAGALGAPGYGLLAAFAAGFLLPLVTGALTHLLPLWLWPGAPAQRHAQARRILGFGSGPAAAIWIGAGAAALSDPGAGLTAGAAALAFFLCKAIVLPFARAARPEEAQGR